MNEELIIQMQGQFDELAQTHPDESTVEFWFARDLQEPLGYARWENFQTAIQQAIESCKTTGYKPEHHFRGVTKLITHWKVGQREIEDSLPNPNKKETPGPLNRKQSRKGSRGQQSKYALSRHARQTLFDAEHRPLCS